MEFPFSVSNLFRTFHVFLVMFMSVLPRSAVQHDLRPLLFLDSVISLCWHTTDSVELPRNFASYPVECVCSENYLKVFSFVEFMEILGIWDDGPLTIFGKFTIMHKAVCFGLACCIFLYWLFHPVVKGWNALVMLDWSKWFPW